MTASVRIDRWLCATRLFKTRTQAQQACAGGRVKLNGTNVRPSHGIKPGDEVRAGAPRGPIVWKVGGLADKRLSAPLAQQLYEDHSPPPPPKEELVGLRERGTGRPTKHERRAMDRFRGKA